MCTKEKSGILKDKSKHELNQEDGMGWDGMGWDGMGWDGMGWDGMGWPYLCKLRETRASGRKYLNSF